MIVHFFKFLWRYAVQLVNLLCFTVIFSQTLVLQGAAESFKVDFNKSKDVVHDSFDSGSYIGTMLMNHHIQDTADQVSYPKVSALSGKGKLKVFSEVDAKPFFDILSLIRSAPKSMEDKFPFLARVKKLISGDIGYNWISKLITSKIGFTKVATTPKNLSPYLNKFLSVADQNVELTAYDFKGRLHLVKECLKQEVPLMLMLKRGEINFSDFPIKKLDGKFPLLHYVVLTGYTENDKGCRFSYIDADNKDKEIAQKDLKAAWQWSMDKGTFAADLAETLEIAPGHAIIESSMFASLSGADDVVELSAN